MKDVLDETYPNTIYNHTDTNYPLSGVSRLLHIRFLHRSGSSRPIVSILAALVRPFASPGSFGPRRGASFLPHGSQLEMVGTE